MSKFVERFVLPILVAIMTAIIGINPWKLDLRQRISLGICVLSLAYFVTHSLGKKTTYDIPVPKQAVEAPRLSGDAQSSGSQSPAVTGDGNNVQYGTDASKSSPKPARQ